MTTSSNPATTTEPIDGELRELTKKARAMAAPLQPIAPEGIQPHALPVASSATWNPPCVRCTAPIGVEMPEGKYVGRTLCDSCNGAVATEKLLHAGIPKWFVESKASLGSFDDRQNQTVLRALEHTLAIVKPLGLFDRIWLVLTGGPGTGKSHLGAAVAQEFIRGGRTARFATFDQVLVEIQDTYSGGEESGDSTAAVVKRYTKDADLLVLDDVGVEPPTAHAIQILYRILNARLNDRQPTVLTTNYPLTSKRGSQPTLGERLSEKLTDDTPVRRILDRIAGEARHEHIDAPSYRRVKK